MTDPFNDPAPAGGRPTTITLASLLDRFTEVDTEGSGYVVTCPSHTDSHPSLWIGYNPDSKKVIFKCRAGCETPSVLNALDLSMTDLFDVEPGEMTDVRTAGRVPESVTVGDRAALKAYLDRTAAALRAAL